MEQRPVKRSGAVPIGIAVITVLAIAVPVYLGRDRPEAALGEPVETRLWAQPDFEDGTLSITAESLEPVTEQTLDRWELDAGGQDAYEARFTVELVEGSWSGDGRTFAFDNGMWVVGVDGDYVKGPSRLTFGGPHLDRVDCPNDAEETAAALRSEGTAEICVLLLAPGGSTVTEIGYSGAKNERTRRSMAGSRTVTWTVDADG